MKRIIVLACVILCLLIPSVLASNSSCFDINQEQSVVKKSYITSYSGIGDTMGKPNVFYVPSIEKWGKIQIYTFNAAKPYALSGSPGHEEQVTVKDGATIIAHGFIGYLDNGPSSITIYMYFDDWNSTGLTGNKALTLDYTNDILGLSFVYAGAHNYGNDLGYPFICAGGSNARPAMVGTSFDQTVYASIFHNELCHISPITGSVHIDLTRYSYTSRLAVFADGTQWFNESSNTDLDITIFGSVVKAHLWNADLTYYKVFDISPGVTPTPTTITPTETPTPAPQFCGYWSFAVNSSNIIRNQWVKGTLTETDPSDNFHKIDWFWITTSGEEVMKYSYVNDPGFFGLGAGWVSVDPILGTATSSSVAAAKENDIQIPYTGKQWIRTKIYRDQSLIPLLYHDYQLICTMDQVVYVSESTQGTNTLNVNVIDSLTRAQIAGVTVNAQNKLTGEWQNKSTPTGGAIQFNVIPGNVYRFLVNNPPWELYDKEYTIPNPPGLYEILLRRPLPDTPGKSWIQFTVKDASTTLNLRAASITLSDGQSKTTLPSGYQDFQVNNSQEYYFTVSKQGYTSATGSFNISVNTEKLVYLYPKVPTTTATTVPGWTQTPTPVQTYPNGTPIDVTTSPTGLATLDVVQRQAKVNEGMDIWYEGFPMLAQLLFLCAIMGAFGLMASSMGGRRKSR